MNKLEAKNLVFNTFEKTFDESRFTYFVRNLLNNFDVSKSQTWAGNYIPESFRNAIKTYKRIGQYTIKDKNVLDVLIVNVKRDNTLERARTLQRNFIARHLKQRNHEAALVAFYTEGYDDWRFSLVKMDFNLNKTKVEIELSPAKRYSFLVGANERSHTAQSQFQKILTEIPNPTLNELEQAFNIESVTREFFLEYRNLFILTKLELDKIIENDPKVRAEFSTKGGSASGGDSKNVTSVDFSKKLLGQIIFLYFLQKKGWFGVERDSDWGTGSKKFLRELFELSAIASAKTEKKHDINFFNDYLEPLFYEALRMDRSHDDHYYSRFNCKIPFLNGGLFDPIGNYDWVHTDINLPNELFSNNHKTKEGDIGDGILDIFDRYNFTVIEDEPLEKEVAIDPELLGKAYEKFNAIRPDNFNEYLKVLKSGKKGEENKFNKQYGVYYTPREIVHYMCRESLINFLASEFCDRTDAYQKVSTEQLDAFGNTTRKGQLALEAEYKPNPYIPKDDIETLINYGELLGENEAVVESKGKETETYYHKLPESIRKNAKLIDEKLADILICDPAVGSGAFPVGMMHEIVSTRHLLSTYIKDKTRTIYNFKRECIEKSLYGVDIDSGAVEITKLRLWLSLVVDEDDFKEIKPLPNLDYKIVCGNSLLGVQKDLLNAHLFDELEKLKPLHFNETNPTKKQEYKNQIDELILKISNGHKDFDFEVYFSEVFHQKKGFDVVIANPPYRILTKNNTNESILNTYISKYNSIKYSYSKNIFTLFIEKSVSILNKKSLLNFIVPEGLFQTRSYKECVDVINKNGSVDSIVTFTDFVFESAITGNIIFLFLKNQKVKTRKFHFDGNFLLKELFEEDDCVINRISLQKTYMLKDICILFKGMVIQDRENFLYESISKGKNILLFGKSISKYVIIKKYYTNYSHLNIIGGTKKLEKHNYFPRIVVRRTGNTLCCAYLSEPALTESTLYSCWSISSDISNKYILSLLNSKLLDYFVKKKMITNKQAFPQILMTDLEELPIIKVNSDSQAFIINYIDEILSAKKQNPQSNTKQLEDQIDIMVYKLYNLTYEEVEIVDPQIGNIISKEAYDKFQIQ